MVEICNNRIILLCLNTIKPNIGGFLGMLLFVEGKGVFEFNNVLKN